MVPVIEVINQRLAEADAYPRTRVEMIERLLEPVQPTLHRAPRRTFRTGDAAEVFTEKVETYWAYTARNLNLPDRTGDIHTQNRCQNNRRQFDRCSFLACEDKEND